MKEQQEKRFVDRLSVLVKRRIFIGKMFLITCAVAVIISLLIPPKYKAAATILPPNTQQDLMMGFLSSGVGGGLSGLAELAGIPGMSSPSDLFAEIMASNRIKDFLIQRFDLQKEFRTEKLHDTYKALDEITKIDVSPVGIISVSVTYTDKYLAAELANAYVEELDKFNTETAMTTGKRYRIFIERRLRSNEDSLAAAEDALRDFQEKHHTVALEVEIEGAIAAIAQLKSEMILLEVQKAAIGSGNINNPHVRKINQQLRELRKQLTQMEFGDTTVTEKGFGAGFAVPFSELPEVAGEYARLVRDVEVQSAIYEVLIQQYEQAKIMELKDTPTVQILDMATPPDRKTSPRRARIVIIAGFLSLILGIILAFVQESFESLKKQPEEYSKWTTIYNKVMRDYVSMKTHLQRIFRKPRKKS